MNEITLIVLFIFSTVIGYILIKNVPSLLHTPLMSGMNALSGITVLGALSAASVAVMTSSHVLSYVAIILAMINISGGFGVTDRMLKMFKKEENE